jgi:hypothetical protein
MNKIIFPLKPGMKGAEVGDLQSALQLFLDRGIIMQNDEAARKGLSAALQRERAEQNNYGRITRKLVSLFQDDRQLQPKDEVHEPTFISMGA